MYRIFFFILFTTFISSVSYARLGDTEQQDSERYGPASVSAQDRLTPIIKNAPSKTYLYQGWKIRAGYLDGIAVRVCYSKISKPENTSELKNDEIEAILKAESHDGRWEKVKPMSLLNQNKTGNSYFDGSQHRWLNTNGSMAYILLGNRTFFVESPEAGKWERNQKNKIEDQRKANIPKF